MLFSPHLPSPHRYCQGPPRSLETRSEWRGTHMLIHTQRTGIHEHTAHTAHTFFTPSTETCIHTYCTCKHKCEYAGACLNRSHTHRQHTHTHTHTHLRTSEYTWVEAYTHSWFGLVHMFELKYFSGTHTHTPIRTHASKERERKVQKSASHLRSLRWPGVIAAQACGVGLY